ncbi:unnamed protein product [Amoebophrya sp. A25]|nr:unnamed protein product [Amoebophrya sp. A25]|eukprot:GSA25T00016077001.1
MGGVLGSPMGLVIRVDRADTVLSRDEDVVKPGQHEKEVVSPVVENSTPPRTSAKPKEKDGQAKRDITKRDIADPDEELTEAEAVFAALLNFKQMEPRHLRKILEEPRAALKDRVELSLRAVLQSKGLSPKAMRAALLVVLRSKLELASAAAIGDGSGTWLDKLLIDIGYLREYFYLVNEQANVAW